VLAFAQAQGGLEEGAGREALANGHLDRIGLDRQGDLWTEKKARLGRFSLLYMDTGHAGEMGPALTLNRRILLDDSGLMWGGEGEGALADEKSYW